MSVSSTTGILQPVPNEPPGPPPPQSPLGAGQNVGTIAQPVALLEECDFSEERDDGEYEYKYTQIIFTDGASIYYACNERRARYEDMSLTELRGNAVFIPPEEIRPFVPKDVTAAPEPLPRNCYVKRPSLLGHNPKSGTARYMLLLEAQVCENFIRSPHVNLAKYYGCVVEGGRIAGLCFTKYAKTLGQRVAEPEGFQHDQMQRWLSGIKQGIDHLHSLGLVHNDINPSNIMFLEGDDNTPILIDFDSCQADGEEKHMKMGTDGWMPEEGFETSTRENDYFGLEKIREFLNTKVRGTENMPA